MYRRLVSAITAAILAVPMAVSAPVTAEEPGDGAMIQLVVGGDIGLGNRMNSFIPRYGPSAVLADRVRAIAAADLAIANLEGVVSDGGVQGVDKGQTAPLYFRGRPEMLEVLESAEITGVTTANNHVGDYGGDAVLDQGRYLDRMGIAHPGAGANASEACEPAYLAADGVRIAYFSVDTTQHRFAATDNAPGTCHLSVTDLAAWRETFGSRISAARERAHVVLFFVHWGANFATAPASSTRELAGEIVRLGVDAVIGGNAHRLQGMEIVEGRPVIYDIGSLLFDFPEPHDSALWTLDLSPRGVERAVALPLIAEPGFTRVADPDEAARIIGDLTLRSEALGTHLENGVIEFDPPHRPGPTGSPGRVNSANGGAPPPTTLPPPDCVEPAVPSHATPLDVPLGDLRLLGMTVEPESIVGPAMIWVETYWMIEASVANEQWIAPRGYPAGTGLSAWGEPHEACDWRWPTTRWRPGEIYVDRYPLRPADSMLRLGGLPALLAGGFSGPLEVRVGVEADSTAIAESPVVASVDMAPPAALQFTLALAALAASSVTVGALFLARRRRTRRSSGESAEIGAADDNG